MIQFDPEVGETWKRIRNEEKLNWMTMIYEKSVRIVLENSGEGSFEETAKELREKIVFCVFRGYSTKGRIRPLDLFILWIPDSTPPFDRARSIHHIEQIVNHLEMVDFLLFQDLSLTSLTCDCMADEVHRVFRASREHIVLDKSISDIHRERFLQKMGGKESTATDRNSVLSGIYAFIKEFLRLMDLFWKMYVQPMSSVNPEYHQLLFASVFNVIEIEKGFYKDITKHFPLKVGRNYDELFNQIIFHCTAYKEFFSYANSYTDLVKSGKDLSSYPQFISLNRKMESELQQKNEKMKNLSDFLRYPLIHVQEFQVHAEELLRLTPPGDEKHKKLELSIQDLSETSVYVDLKDQEIEFASKTVELSNRFKINELRNETKRQMIHFNSCRYKKERGEIIIYTDCVVLYNASCKAPIIIFIGKQDLNLTCSEKDDKLLVIEVGKKKYEVNLYDRTKVDHFRDLCEAARDEYRRLFEMEKMYKSRVIFQSWLEKEGGGKFSYNLKNRWHVLTADHKMTYYEKPDGKVKGTYFVQACTVGKGRHAKGGKRRRGLGRVLGRKKKKKKDKENDKSDAEFDSWMYVETDERVYGMIAPDPLLLDTWVRILESTGCYRKDILEGKEKEWHDKMIKMILGVDGDEETEGET